jgi:hypothetical protein
VFKKGSTSTIRVKIFAFVLNYDLLGFHFFKDLFV